MSKVKYIVVIVNVLSHNLLRQRIMQFRPINPDIILANEFSCRLEFTDTVYAVKLECLPTAAIKFN